MSPKSSDDDVKVILKRWDPNSDGMVDCLGFVYWIRTGLDIEDVRTKFTSQTVPLNIPVIEGALDQCAGKGSSLDYRDFVDAAEMIGVCMSYCEIQWLFQSFLSEGEDKGEDRVKVKDVLRFVEESTAREKGEKKPKRDKKANTAVHGITLLSKETREDVGNGVTRFLDDAEADKSLGKILLEHADPSSHALNRRQLRKV